ncbi:tRNA (adenosine(37)-N6)-threonylcarbamoyltransferase complex dimerization subunit type 1 TsaB [Candidatus Gracilibacteria bacterium]|nr:tRNA (adenosine(37)-N6)-threonylcarbamoyltransferase complex dimerization subunit type 1 TsaB [Candidatus Gracilibacteria bacterium]NJP20916.1 tRNA (adenosine(37)-N6)-threonylcarbamoyltransferase complex dimerization subunit type 1 TsaB [Hydrococcus sp. CRU_1_1]
MINLQKCDASYALALHTSSAQLGLSLSNFTDENRTQTWDLDRELSTYLHQYLVEFLKPLTWKNLVFLAVAKGPGSFTSSRIGVVTARTLAQQLDIPLFAISSLAAIAWSHRDRIAGDKKIAIQMEATRGQVYAGIYQIPAQNTGLTAYLPDTAIAREAWQQSLEQLATPYELITAPTHLGVTANSLLELAQQEWQAGKRPNWVEVLPFYGN